jgi:hypothetical protein
MIGRGIKKPGNAEPKSIHYPDAEKLIWVSDNLNVHTISSLYEASPPEKALRFEMHHTPKHGSWLNPNSSVGRTGNKKYIENTISCCTSCTYPMGESDFARRMV